MTPERSNRRTLPLLTLLLLLVLPSAALLAEGLPTAKPSDVGLSAERLARIDEAMSGYVERDEAAGIVALIARQGKVAYLESWGHRDRENRVPMTEDTIFRIYSMTKPITSVAVMMLMEEGRFFLDEPIGRHLPELASLEVMVESSDPETGETKLEREPLKRPVTIRDLLRHTAGFTYGVFGNTAVDKMYRDAGLLADDEDLADMTRKLGEIPLLFQPGERWHYSVSIDVLGRLVEVASGQPFDVFLRERIFEPLGMVDTGFVVPKDKLDRFAQLYSPKGTEPGIEAWLRAVDSKEIVIADEMASQNYYEGASFFSGGGGLVSTAADYLRFCQMILDGGELDGVRLLSPKTVELMSADHLIDVPGETSRPLRAGTGFGLGFQVINDLGGIAKPSSPGTLSWGGAAGTRFWIDPEEELIGVFMVQILPHRTRMGDTFELLTYQSIVD